jgi:hypothetical protein
MYPNQPTHLSLLGRINRLWQNLQIRRGLVFGAIIVLALLAFELFNFTTTEFALTDLLGDVRFLGLRWAAILAIAFCGMDFAGIARLFTPERGQAPKTEIWYLLGAWFLAAAMNALLTWWGVSLALLQHVGLGNEILSREALLTVVPVFVAALVVLIRVLLIGTFSMAGDRLFTQAGEARQAAPAGTRPSMAAPRPAPRAMPPAPPPPDDLDWEEAGQHLHPPLEPRRVSPPPRVVGQPQMSKQPTPLRPAPKPAPKPAALPGELGAEVNGHNQSEPR